MQSLSCSVQSILQEMEQIAPYGLFSGPPPILVLNTPNGGATNCLLTPSSEGWFPRLICFPLREALAIWILFS